MGVAGSRGDRRVLSGAVRSGGRHRPSAALRQPRPPAVRPARSWPGLATAQQMQARFSLPFPLVQADAECCPFASASFDVAVSEYGAAIWCDPYRWVPEAARLLRPGGRLIFLGNSTVLMLCAPDEDDVAATEHMVRPQRGMHRFAWPDTAGIEFHLSHGDMLRLLRASGFDVEDLVELYPPEGSTTRYPF
ncbi:MAG TPA: methyltransferase domain-containing protein, partial [Acidimicrobiales bacterium]